jgi:hypothetical protein
MMNAQPPLGLPIGGPKRRLNDRLVDREGTSNPSLADRYELQNLLLLIDDDLRETALSIRGIERFLADALRLLDGDALALSDLHRLAGDDEVLERMDTLCETLGSLRRRMGSVAAALK